MNTPLKRLKYSTLGAAIMLVSGVALAAGSYGTATTNWFGGPI